MASCWLSHPHPSKLERAYCNWLRLREKAGEIKSFKVWPSIKLHIKGKIFKTWKADFLVTELDGSNSVHEAKGYSLGSQREFKIKAALFMREYPKIPLFINRVKMDPTAKRWAIPGLKERKCGRFNGYDKQWLKKNFVYDFKSGRYVRNEKKGDLG